MDAKETGLGNSMHYQTDDWDEDFINELEERRKSFEDGTAKTYT
jgi:hypothetical protein